jgi:hypothetical protein
MTRTTEPPTTTLATRQEQNRQRSLAAFMAEKERFDALLADLQRMSADHMGADPDAVLWGNVGEVQHWNGLLAQVTDAYFRRGEHAR